LHEEHRCKVEALTDSSGMTRRLMVRAAVKISVEHLRHFGEVYLDLLFVE
jgi:hypothetical protein